MQPPTGPPADTTGQPADTKVQPAVTNSSSTVNPVEAEVANEINKNPDINPTVKPTLIRKILDKLNIKDLPPDQKDVIINAEIENAKRETGKIEHSFTNSVSPKLSAKEKVAIFTSVGTGLAAIADAIKTNPVLMQLAVAGSGLILATPVGQGIVGVVAICAVGYYAVLAVKAKFQGLYTVLRTLDEFTILLEKIQRMIRVTVFISTTYNFQINVDEINNQIKIILKRFEKTLDDVDIQKIKSQATDAHNLESLSANTSNAAANAVGQAAKTALFAANQQETGVQNNGGGVGVGGGSGNQKGGGFLATFYKKFTFPVESWNRELLDDVTKLNIRLTTAMGEFTIVLNVIQMNMIADGFRVLKPTTGQKIDAVDTFVKHTTDVKKSSVYKIMRIGILINDILSLRVDFEFCNQGNKLTRPNDDAICLEYTQTDTAGNRIMTFRPKLHDMVILLCDNLMTGEGYDDGFKLFVKTNVIDPYIKLLEDAKIPLDASDASYASKLTITTDTLKKLYLKETSLAVKDKQIINENLDNLVEDIKTRIPIEGGAQGGGNNKVGGGWFNKTPSAPAGPTAAEINIIKYLKGNPVELISHDALKLYLDTVYKFSKEITKQSEEEKNETKNAVILSAVDSAVPVNPVPVQGHGVAVASAVVSTDAGLGGSRRNRKRPTTRKYSKSSSSVKKGKTYKIRI
jgi:hypothetical protein